MFTPARRSSAGGGDHDVYTGCEVAAGGFAAVEGEDACAFGSVDVSAAGGDAFACDVHGVEAAGVRGEPERYGAVFILADVIYLPVCCFSGGVPHSGGSGGSRQRSVA